MLARLLLVLLLFVVGLPRPGVAVQPARPIADHACAVPDCCRVERRVSCCERKPAEAYCPKTGGPCRCGVRGLPKPDKTPPAQLPRQGKDRDLAMVRGPSATCRSTSVANSPCCHGPRGQISAAAGPATTGSRSSVSGERRREPL